MIDLGCRPLSISKPVTLKNAIGQKRVERRSKATHKKCETAEITQSHLIALAQSRLRELNDCIIIPQGTFHRVLEILCQLSSDCASCFGDSIVDESEKLGIMEEFVGEAELSRIISEVHCEPDLNPRNICRAVGSEYISFDEGDQAGL